MTDRPDAPRISHPHVTLEYNTEYGGEHYWNVDLWDDGVDVPIGTIALTRRHPGVQWDAYRDGEIMPARMHLSTGDEAVQWLLADHNRGSR